MLKKFTINILILAAFLSGCAKLSPSPDESASKQNAPVPPPKETYVNDSASIKLQNLKTRIIVVCRESYYETAETCARFYEKRNYVRLTDIPYKVAKYDRLTKDTFPTRRWRNGERTPRW